MSEELQITKSSGNVFADLELPDPGTRLVKAELARGISLEIEARKMTQREAAAILGSDQPKASTITRGRLRDFSLDRLLTLLGRLGMDVEIIVTANRESARGPRLVVHTADAAAAVSR